MRIIEYDSKYKQDFIDFNTIGLLTTSAFLKTRKKRPLQILKKQSKMAK